MLLPTAAQRRRQPEIIDQPDLDPGRLAGALRGLERINWWSHSAGILWPPIRAFARRQTGSLRLLDIATGAGDVPIRLWRKAQGAGLRLEVTGCDRSPHAVRYARAKADAVGVPARFFEWDVVADGIPASYDIVTCSLFLHHLESDEAVALLRGMAAAARLVLVNDLVRGRAGFLLAYLGTRLLTGSPIVHSDGPRSVEAAFTLAEVRDLSLRAGLTGVTVQRRWPFRLLLQWWRP
jgi:2-polyprenyl-3-methyl-5-hydroxy-6-metoxy-1,4-benzoquinol methylase